MGYEPPTRAYAFERIFALSDSDASRSPQDAGLHLLALQAELAELRRGAEPALAQARADGFAAGLAQAQTETAAALVQTETTLAAAIAGLETEFCVTEARIAAVAADVCLAAAELLAASAVAADPLVAIDAALARVLAQTGFREQLHLRVHPSLADPVAALVASRQSAEQRPLMITVHADPGVAVGDAQILWDQGGLGLDAGARRAAVRDALGIAPNEG
jgi:flagellar assembly protein FliH